MLCFLNLILNNNKERIIICPFNYVENDIIIKIFVHIFVQFCIYDSYTGVLKHC